MMIYFNSLASKLYGIVYILVHGITLCDAKNENANLKRHIIIMKISDSALWYSLMISKGAIVYRFHKALYERFMNITVQYMK